MFLERNCKAVWDFNVLKEVRYWAADNHDFILHFNLDSIYDNLPYITTDTLNVFHFILKS